MKMVSSTAWILSMKVLFISIGAASMALFFKVSVPLIVEFLVSQVPLLWSSILSWFRPPYLYIVINGIIISIAASSRLHRSHESSVEESPLMEAMTLPPEDSNERDDEGKEKQQKEEGEKEEEFVISRSTWTPTNRSGSSVQEFLPQSPEKPLASSIFPHRRPSKSSPEGSKALKVTRLKQHETLENTWKAIAESRPMPLTRQPRRPDAQENGSGCQAQLAQLSSPQQQKKMRKSETFRDRTNEQEWSPFSETVRKAVVSPSQEELNRRVDAFIKKFNEEMRLQRQESLNHYKQMISKSAADY
ncbi:hypothetical protein SAY86_022562 [Trapa natans]|uniref:DUF4408 domain-containing protein n=1 Tax=Trapa natans TaxID=22666 RepID=A0AAN7M5F1_TRANT|nr:hypothetical protein SAY86_022562 [Trapa natans]